MCNILKFIQTMIFVGSLGNEALDLKMKKIIFRMNFRIFDNHRETSEFIPMNDQ